MLKREVIKKAKDLVRTISSDHLKLGRVLVLISVNEWFMPTATTVVGWSEKQLGLKPSITYGLMSIARCVDRFKIPDHVVADLGWAKFAACVPFMTEENYKSVLGKAYRYGTARLVRMLKGHSSNVTKGFWLKPAGVVLVDRAIGQAKAMFDADSEGEALEAICETFLRM